VKFSKNIMAFVKKISFIGSTATRTKEKVKKFGKNRLFAFAVSSQIE
jgi:hypothetical protein